MHYIWPSRSCPTSRQWSPLPLSVSSKLRLCVTALGMAEKNERGVPEASLPLYFLRSSQCAGKSIKELLFHLWYWSALEGWRGEGRGSQEVWNLQVRNLSEGVCWSLQSTHSYVPSFIGLRHQSCRWNGKWFRLSDNNQVWERKFQIVPDK